MNIQFFKKTTLIICTMIISSLALSACSTYRPLNARNGNHTYMNNIDIATIEEREGQILHNYLIDYVQNNGESANPEYRLIVTQTQRVTALGVSKNDDSTRAQMITTAQYSLISTITGEERTHGTVQNINSFNRLTGQYSSHVTEEQAKETGLENAARDISTELQLFFARN